ncbi:MAG: hypothetical protein IKN74_06090 [Clostridia bacterium]|nr:hypothetical protein [Clostridia bacterium]
MIGGSMKLDMNKRKNIAFLMLSILYGAILLYIGTFVVPGSEDSIVYICSAIALLLFGVWFLFDSILL